MLRDRLYNVLAAVGAAAIYQRARPPGGAVLMCHSIGYRSNSAFDPNGKWRITSELLDKTIACADDMGFEAVTMDVAVDRLRGDGNDRPFYVLTFDDGYADNLHAALPVCTRNRVPMTTYITSGFVQRKHVAWWHLIEHLIANNSTIQLSIKECPITFDCNSLLAKQETFDQLAQLLTFASTLEQSAFVEQVCDRYGAEPRASAESLFLTAAELQEFSRSDYVCLGVHGASHCAFASLATDELEQELEESVAYLTSLTDSRPRHLAYPYGSPATVNEREFDVAQRSGFTTGVTTRHGCLSGDEISLLSLPRIPVFPADTENSLRCKLSGLTTPLAKWRRT